MSDWFVYLYDKKGLNHMQRVHGTPLSARMQMYLLICTGGYRYGRLVQRGLPRIYPPVSQATAERKVFAVPKNTS